VEILLKKNNLSSAQVTPGVLAELVQACSRNESGVGDSAPCFLHDPLLALRLLTSAPLPAPTPRNTELIRPALACYSASQIRAFALSLLPATPELLPTLRECWLRSIKVALLAQDIAEKSGSCPGEWAWVAGLFHNLEDWWRIQGLGEDFAFADWKKLDAYGLIADAVRYCGEPLARVKTAHTLVKVVHAAHALARESGADIGEAQAALANLGVDRAEVVALAQRASTQLELLANRYGMGNPEQAGGIARDSGSMAQLIGAYSRLAGTGVFQEALPAPVSLETLGKRLSELVPLLFGAPGAVLFKLDRNLGALRLMTDPSLPPALHELSFTLDDPLSCLSLAAQGRSVRWTREDADRFAVLDEQFARLLRAHSVLYQPLSSSVQVEAVLALVNPAERLEDEATWQSLVARIGAGLNLVEQPAVAPSLPISVSDAIPRDQVRRAVHEVANPLTIMRNYVKLLSGKLESDESSQRDLKIINDEIERVARILRELAKGTIEKDLLVPAEETSNVAINPVISELVRMSLGTLFMPNRISVQIDLDPDIPQIPSHRDKLKQVLLNLAKNAVEAMPRGGRLIFTTRMRADISPPRLEIAVRDNGPGLPDAVLERLYEPGDSGKGGDHAGLGLSISRNLVRNLGGEIECDTGQNGTEFRILLPVTHSARASLRMAG
jgi:signal transduction histidine kinase